jgi:SAM-dependent methyltransferase
LLVKLVIELFYELGYRHGRMLWEGGPRSELAELVRTGRLEPCRALDLGCGSGANAFFLAEHGFEVDRCRLRRVSA